MAYALQEEDFVGQLYNRNLLSLFDASHFYRLLDQAVAWVDAETDMDQKLRDAIRCRLLFRREFLSALDGDLEILDTRSTDNFSSCLSHLAALTESVSLGKEVPEAFSMKIQRKLASTVPPRPIVNISSKDALAHMRRLCQDAIDMQQMLDYRGPSNFKVESIEMLPCARLLILISDCCMDPVVPQAPALRLHPIFASGSDRE
jgi:hypothetical protein